MKKFFSSWHLGVALASTGLLGISHPAMAALPSLSLNDVSVTEGNSGTVNAAFTIKLSAASAEKVTVKYETADTTTTANADYKALPSTLLVFTAGQTSKIVNVQVKADLIDEADETFSLKLSGATAATIADATGVGKILDDDTSTITATGASVPEGNSGTVPLNFTLKLSTPNSRTVTVKAKTTDAPAVPATVNSDYVGLGSTTIAFAPGETTKVVPVSVKGDLLDEEAKEYVGLSLTSPMNALVGSVGVGTIVDDDDAPAISVANVTATEGNTTDTSALFKVSLSAASGKPITVKYATANSTASAAFAATANVDYTALPLTELNFAHGETVKTVSVTIKPDVIDEEDEQFLFKLSAATNATIANTATGTIADNDTSVLSVVPDPTHQTLEVDEGTSQLLIYEVRLSTPNSRNVTVLAKSTDASTHTATANADYIPISKRVGFNPGVTEMVVYVNVVGDLIDEDNENVDVVLSDPSNAALGNSSQIRAEGVIVDNDDAPSLRIRDVSVQQVISGTTDAPVDVQLSAPSSRTITVQYSTVDGTATAGSDYVAVGTTTLTFTPGESQKAIHITVKSEPGASNRDDDENFKVVLKNASNATLLNNTGVVTILDDVNSPPDANSLTKSIGNYNRGQRIHVVIKASEAGTDADGDPLFFTFCDTASDDNGGVASFSHDEITFTTPPLDGIGDQTATFNYTISDGIAESMGTMTLNYYINPPTIRATPPAPSQKATSPSAHGS